MKKFLKIAFVLVVLSGIFYLLTNTSGMPGKNQMTEEVWSVLEKAHQLTIDNQQDTVSSAHLLLSFVNENNVPLGKCLNDRENLVESLRRNIQETPKKVGVGGSYSLYLSQEVKVILSESEKLQKEEGASKIDSKHVLLSLTRNANSLQSVLSDNRVTENLITDCFN